MRDLVVLSRAELYGLVWREPVSKVAQRFGLSGAGLGKVCVKHGVPVPPRGYWAKLVAGNKVTQPRLPRPENGDDKVRFHRNDGGVEAVRDARASKLAEPVVARREFETARENKIVVAASKARLGAWASEIRAGLRSKSSYYGNRVDYRGMREASLGSGVLTVVVSDSVCARAVAIVDALESALRKRRFLTAKREGGSRLVVEGVELRLRLSERATRTPRSKDKRKRSNDDISWMFERQNDYAPSGALTLKISSGSTRASTVEKTLVDTEGQPLEGALNGVMILLAEVAVKTQLKEVRLEEQRRQQQLEWQRQEEARQRREAEAARARLLLEQSDRWTRAEQLRAFIAAVEKSGRVPPSVAGELGLEEWVAWAGGQADAIDPLQDAG